MIFRDLGGEKMKIREKFICPLEVTREMIKDKWKPIIIWRNRYSFPKSFHNKISNQHFCNIAVTFGKISYFVFKLFGGMYHTNTSTYFMISLHKCQADRRCQMHNGPQYFSLSNERHYISKALLCKSLYTLDLSYHADIRRFLLKK